jgi:hypothetical protein
MKNLLTTIAFALGVVLAYGQQEYSFTHYFETNSFFRQQRHQKEHRILGSYLEVNGQGLMELLSQLGLIMKDH